MYNYRCQQRVWQGIGKELALLLGEKGCKLILAAREENELKEVAKKIKNLGGEAISLKADVSNYINLKNIVDTAIRRFKTIDILINNVGIMIVKPFEKMTKEECEKTIDVNLKALINLTLLVYPHMLKKGKGHIVNISSIAGKRPSIDKAPYCASKFGVTGFSLALAQECKNKGIKITNVCPGAMKTHLYNNIEEKYKKRLRFMEPKEVARMLIPALESDDIICMDEIIITQMQ